MIKPWTWEPSSDGITLPGNGWILLDGRRRTRANVWSNGTWHTWDTDGVGGENGACEGRHAVQDAMDQTMAAVARQGWTPWKVAYPRNGQKKEQKG